MPESEYDKKKNIEDYIENDGENNIEKESENETENETEDISRVNSKKKKLKNNNPKIHSKPKINREEIIKKLNGRTLMIYFVLLNKNSTGVRELQRQLDLSSPSVARYHLDKLTELNLVENRNGTYFLVRKADLPVLTSWVLIGKYFLPRALFAAIFFTLLFIGYFLLIYSIWNKHSFYIIIFGLSVLGYLWWDVKLHFNNRPI